ncbi:MAG: hypothetical protein R3339_08110 [Thermodesulfobacteriota bacterium]|nr:hypothetical protein [Thermodesulfobacteriota bacterium]
MPKAIIRFYEELNDHLPTEMQKVDCPFSFLQQIAVKDVIESMGIPYDEVDLILANGMSVDFSYLVKGGDRISVYPIFERFDITGLTKVRDKPLRFVKKKCGRRTD